MKVFERVRRYAFWPLALLWLPVGVVAQAAVRFPPERYSAADPAMLAEAAASLAVLVPCGLPLSLACRRLWRIGYRRSALWTWVALGTVSVAGAIAAGLLGPLAIVICTVALSLPAWGASFWLSRRG